MNKPVKPDMIIEKHDGPYAYNPILKMRLDKDKLSNDDKSKDKNKN